MTKAELVEKLYEGAVLEDLFLFTPGDDCLIYKAEQFTTGEQIIYIPDIVRNGLFVSTKPYEIDFENILFCCYTGNDFIRACRDAGVEVKYAERLFWLCDWQHPSTILAEGWPDEED